MDVAGECDCCGNNDFVLDHNICHNYVDYCLFYSKTTKGQCGECENDFVLTTKNTCLAKTENCKTHNGAGKCSACNKD